MVQALIRRGARLRAAGRTRIVQAALWIGVGMAGVDATIPRADAAKASRPAGAGLDPQRIQQIAGLLIERPKGLGRPITDRAAWESPGVRAALADVLAEADRVRAEPMPRTTDDLYLDYSRTGNRTRWQDVMHDRRKRLGLFVLAECVENKGQYLRPFVEAVESVCGERTWVYPAHDASLRNFKGETIDVDLGSVAVGWTLATADWLLGEKLDPPVRALIRRQVRQRVLDPFREMVEGRRPANWWLTGTNNWNAVCLAGVTGSALALLEAREERAFFVAAAEHYAKYFRAGIPEDGYCTEGVGYWNYGFGNYVALAETLLQATGGGVDLLEGKHARRIAMYGLQIEMAPGICPAFADCSVGARPSARLVDYIGRRWGLPVSAPPPPQSLSLSPLYAAMMYIFPNSVSSQPTPPRMPLPARTWFDRGGVLISRPGSADGCRLAVAMKGGHNAEQHNHNDVGSYVAVAGGQAVLVDPGAEVYTARTFSERRYDSQVINSFGHPVPQVAGQLQRTGQDARGRVLRADFTDEVDTLALDIRSAYDVPALETLERTFVYSRRGAGSLTVTDEVVFKSPQAFGTALVTFGAFRRLGPDRLIIEDGGASVEVRIRAAGGEIAVQAEELHEDLLTKRTPTRIGVNFAGPVGRGTIALTISPAGAVPASGPGSE